MRRWAPGSQIRVCLNKTFKDYKITYCVFILPFVSKNRIKEKATMIFLFFATKVPNIHIFFLQLNKRFFLNL